MTMTDSDLLALCVLEEAGGEIDDGRAAVARVIRNRMTRKYESDGTVAGTVLKYDQFSWAWFGFVHGHYIRIADTDAEATVIAQRKLIAAPHLALEECRSIATQVMSGTYRGTLYDCLTDDTVLYLNPRIVSHRPVWATNNKQVCKIGNHVFYRA